MDGGAAHVGRSPEAPVEGLARGAHHDGGGGWMGHGLGAGQLLAGQGLLDGGGEDEPAGEKLPLLVEHPPAPGLEKALLRRGREAGGRRKRRC